MKALKLIEVLLGTCEKDRQSRELKNFRSFPERERVSRMTRKMLTTHPLRVPHPLYLVCDEQFFNAERVLRGTRVCDLDRLFQFWRVRIMERERRRRERVSIWAVQYTFGWLGCNVRVPRRLGHLVPIKKKGIDRVEKSIDIRKICIEIWTYLTLFSC